MTHAIANNVRNVRDHYNRLFDLLGREELLSSMEPTQRPPIMNLGYWSYGAKTAREAQVRMVHELASRIGNLQGSRLLDVGCGLCGPATILATDYGAQVDCININQQQIAIASRFIAGNGLRERVRVHLANAMEMPFADETFDVVFCLEAAHCFAEKSAFLAEARRVLRPGGKLALADITATLHNGPLSWLPALKLRLVTATDWRKMMEAAGFSIVREESIACAVYPGFRRWLRFTARDRRNAILKRICGGSESLALRSARWVQAWALELALCRSFLRVLSWLRLRDYAILISCKR